MLVKPSTLCKGKYNAMLFLTNVKDLMTEAIFVSSYGGDNVNKLCCKAF